MEEQKKTDNKAVQQNVKQKKKRDIKKALRNLTAMVLVVAITVVLTLAFLNRVSNRKTNTFTGTNTIKLDLQEPEYNDDGTGTPKDPTKPNPNKYNPEQTYDKDPTLYNISETADAYEWVAIRLDYKLNEVAVDYQALTVTYGAVNQILSGVSSGGAIMPIAFDTANWIQLTDAEINDAHAKYDIWVYKYPLKGANKASATYTDCDVESTGLTASNGYMIPNGNKTTPLFSNVKTLSQTQLENNGYDTSKQLPGFKIDIIGAAVNIPSEYVGQTGESNELKPLEQLNATYVTEVKTALVNLLKANGPT